MGIGMEAAGAGAAGHRAAPVLPPAGILAELAPAERQLLSEHGTFLELRAHEVVIAQGEPQSSLFVLLEGQLKARCRTPLCEVFLGVIKVGESVGEMALLDAGKASATVSAARHSRLWQISREAFEQFLERAPGVEKKILRSMGILLSRRLRRSSDRLLRQAESRLHSLMDA